MDVNENRSIKTDFDRALAENAVALEKFGALTEQEGGPWSISAIITGRPFHWNGRPVEPTGSLYFFSEALRRKISRRKSITLNTTNSAAHTTSTIHDFPTLCGATPTRRNIGAPKRIAQGMW